ncbi:MULTISPECIES: histidine phosphatase family protein [unclassified Kitasatospora]|uniref:histidine phosphatase family protein n=1 Tax=unclassified Kitasatospora TaxID=2633591 RepID=UPI003823D2AF
MTSAPNGRVAAPALSDPPTTLLLLRHGETALTPDRRFSGSGGTDPALSAAGLDQAARAGASALLTEAPVHAVISSPLRRCRQTAQAAAERLGLGVRIEDGLREADFGDWEGLTLDEVRARHPADLRAWQESGAAPTGAVESLAQVAERTAATRDALLARHPGRRLLLVSHVTPIKTLMAGALGAPAGAVHAMYLSPASFSALVHTGPRTAMHLYNDTSHLR